jgi:hypothetical protein
VKISLIRIESVTQIQLKPLGTASGIHAGIRVQAVHIVIRLCNCCEHALPINTSEVTHLHSKHVTKAEDGSRYKQKYYNNRRMLRTN